MVSSNSGTLPPLSPSSSGAGNVDASASPSTNASYAAFSSPVPLRTSKPRSSTLGDFTPPNRATFGGEPSPPAAGTSSWFPLFSQRYSSMGLCRCWSCSRSITELLTVGVEDYSHCFGQVLHLSLRIALFWNEIPFLSRPVRVTIDSPEELASTTAASPRLCFTCAQTVEFNQRVTAFNRYSF